MAAASSTAESNPLLRLSVFPRFDLIRCEHVVPAIRCVLQHLEGALPQLESRLQPTWVGLMEPLERIEDQLSRVWGTVEHLMNVKYSDELRRAHQEVQADVVRFLMRLKQSLPIYRGLKSLKGRKRWHRLDPVQQRIVEAWLRDAALSGAGLPRMERERLNAIERELAELGTQFSHNLLDATKAFALTLERLEEVEGLPLSVRQLAAHAARAAGASEATPEHGPWRITLDDPSFIPFMGYSRCRGLRERLYRAFITRASTGAENNTPLITRILSLRQEKAALLGYHNFAELSLATKMAADVPTVERFLEELRQASFAAARRELEELRDWARAQQAAEAEELPHWDIPFWAARLREYRYGISDEKIRCYFPFPQVLAGLFALTHDLFGVKIVSADGEAPVWHQDVRFFRVYNEQNQELAAFYLDPYSRPAEKRGGAWINGCIGRSRLLAMAGRPVRLPIAYLATNQTPPIGGKPSLMTFQEVKTLFHEFGHALQHMLTTVDYGMASGLRNVEWDAVELASQFMENWCYHRQTLLNLSAHVDSGDSLPDDLCRKLCAARHFRAGSLMLRQLYFAFLDLELHTRFESNGSKTIFDVQRRIARKTLIPPRLAEDRFLCSFAHIFARKHAAGYYSYKWEEVLSADAFAAFEEAGLENKEALKRVGRRYRDTILAMGGSRPARDVFREFRGRESTTAVLLRQVGLAG